ncbi:hypothetical protein X777_06630 [Ooceraea biroi]|uniref:Uncharacterized protein n=1 Tax=Ooceraea biroi TaxID=2015173 RepID=A0A026WFL5_OOCBI|nr:hypothetical protein X777_06630 [Ooceraea biroi]
MYKILREHLPRVLRERVELVGEGNQRETRQKGNIAVQLRKTCEAQRSIFYKGVKMYNDLPIEVKQCESVG